MKIEKGQTVVLNSGGPQMVMVEKDVSDGKYLCFWLDKNGHTRSNWFAGERLTAGEIIYEEGLVWKTTGKENEK